ncbi:hypothetical protein [Streptomyces scabiei]|uniref:Secreted protein n=1 Tax=Streptomyces scabiei TaxID=1930 RepID=A0A100JIX3_STRSC|nr:hypothetical protein [Streptomyces scabiei]GAQ60392.1 hypothetical protein SsS58_00732 [Streptomyces scabiei]
MRKAVLGVLVALAAVLGVAVTPLASADTHHTDTAACCGKPPVQP